MPDAEQLRAIEEIVALARRHGLSAADVAAALGDPAIKTADRSARAQTVLVRALGALGGIFVFAGIGVFVALQWDEMNSAARGIVTLGSGLAAFALAVLSLKDPRFEKAATPLLLIAAALEPTGMLVAFREFGSGGDWHAAGLVTAGTTAAQFAGTFFAIRRSSALFVTIVFATLFWWTALDWLDADGNVIALVIGAWLLLIAMGIDRTPHRDITAAWYLFGAAAFLNGLFDMVKRTPLELVFVSTAAGFVYLSVALRSRMLLFVSTVAILAYTGWFTGERFADSLGWPIALVVFGLFMIALSALAFRIDREYVRRRSPQPLG